MDLITYYKAKKSRIFITLGWIYCILMAFLPYLRANNKMLIGASLFVIGNILDFFDTKQKIHLFYASQTIIIWSLLSYVSTTYGSSIKISLLTLLFLVIYIVIYGTINYKIQKNKTRQRAIEIINKQRQELKTLKNEIRNDIIP
jgi:hypothetical protein